MPPELALRLRHWLAIVALLTTTSGATAQELSAKEKARQHFERALSLSNSGALEAANAEFIAAYDASPHHSVLFNIAQTYSALGRPVEAADTFERYLTEAGDRIDARRKLDVGELLAAQRARIGSVDLDVEPHGARVSVDGRPVGVTPLGTPVRLAAGTHGLAVEADGHATHAQPLQVTAAKTVAIQVRLPSLHRPSAGELVPHCPVPDVTVLIDGQPRALTPARRPLSVRSGMTTVRFERRGYSPSAHTVHVVAGRATRVDCALEPILDTQAGTLLVRPVPGAASVRVDGTERPGPLPSGKHVVSVTHPGYVEWRRVVTLPPATTRRLTATLQPTSQTRRDALTRARARQRWALVSGLTGLGLGGASVALYAWNSGRHAELEDDLRQTSAEAAADRAAELTRVDALAVGLGVGSAAALTCAALLWLTGDSVGLEF